MSDVPQEEHHGEQSTKEVPSECEDLRRDGGAALILAARLKVPVLLVPVIDLCYDVQLGRRVV